MRKILLLLLAFATFLLNSCCPCPKQQETKDVFDSIQISLYPGMCIPFKVRNLVIYPNNKVKKYINTYLENHNGDSIIPLSSSEQMRISILAKGLFITKRKKAITSIKNHSYSSDMPDIMVKIYDIPFTTYEYDFGYEGITYSDDFKKLLQYLR